MKKKWVWMLATMLLLLPLAGCQQDEPAAHGSTETYGSTENAITKYDNESVVPLEPSGAGMLVQEKKYDYKGKNVMILRVENQTGNDYSIRLTGHFLDEGGKEILSQNKTFEGFAAGYYNYFVFQPSVGFEDFSYTLNAVTYDDTTYAQYIQTDGEISVGIGKTMRDFTTLKRLDNNYVGVFANFPLHNTYTEPLHYAADFVLFDKQGNIYIIDDQLQETLASPTTEKGKRSIGIFTADILWTDKDDYELPKELQGKVAGIVAIRAVSTSPLK